MRILPTKILLAIAKDEESTYSAMHEIYAAEALEYAIDTNNTVLLTLYHENEKKTESAALLVKRSLSLLILMSIDYFVSSHTMMQNSETFLNHLNPWLQLPISLGLGGFLILLINYGIISYHKDSFLGSKVYLPSSRLKKDIKNYLADKEKALRQKEYN